MSVDSGAEDSIEELASMHCRKAIPGDTDFDLPTVEHHALRW